MNDERKKAFRKMKTARGQLDDIIYMMEEGRYCTDTSNQISVSAVLLKKTNQCILDGHLYSCVLTIIEGRNVGEKVSKVEAVIAALLKQKEGRSYE